MWRHLLSPSTVLFCSLLIIWLLKNVSFSSSTHFGNRQHENKRGKKIKRVRETNIERQTVRIRHTKREKERGKDIYIYIEREREREVRKMSVVVNKTIE